MLIAALAPLALLLAHFWFWPGPVGVFNWGEPDFGYLLNSADIKLGSPPGHTDHPGTTVQSLGVAILALEELAHTFTPGFEWYDDLLLRPAHYHLLTSLFLLAAAALALFALGFALLNAGHSVGLVVLVQLLTFLPFNTWYYIPRVSPEKLLFFLNCALAGWLALREGEARRRWSFPLYLGFLLGFSLATKYNSLTLLGFLLVVPSFTRKLAALLATGASFFFFTLPMAEVYGMSFRWLQRLSGHQGLYGTGEKGALPTAGALVENFQLLWHDDSALLSACLSAVLFGLVLAWRRRSFDCLVAAAVLVAHFALVLKHPATRYLLPMVVPLLLVFFHAFRSTRWFAWAAAAVVFALVPGVVSSAHMTVAGIRDLGPIHDELEGFRASHPECHWGYISPVPRLEWALSAGNGSSWRRHTQSLLRLYPEALSYDVSPPHFHRFSSAYPLGVVEERVKEGKGCLYLGGVSYRTAEEQLKHAPFYFDKIWEQKSGAYVLKVTRFFEMR